MKCAICKQGETRPGLFTLTLVREPMVLVFKGVPANVCDNCAEEYLSEDITARLLELVEVQLGLASKSRSASTPGGPNLGLSVSLDF